MKTQFKLEKISIFMISIFIFLTMYYYDNQLTFVYIIENMHRITNGEWYYIFNGWTAIPYGLILQAVCAVWSLPIFILSEFGVISTTCVGARLWYKLFVLIFLLLDTWQIGLIADKMGIESKSKCTWIRLYFISSILVILPALHIAQMDAVYLFPVLVGIYFYLNNDYRKFLLCFAIAIPIKFIPLFIFVPLVLMKEKRYLFIARDLGIGCIGIVADRIINSIGYRIENYLGVTPGTDIPDVGGSVMQGSLGNLLGSGIQAFNVDLSIALLLFVLLCIWCYSQKSAIRSEMTIFACTLGLLSLFVFGTITTYWILLIVPFLLLLIFKDDQHYHILLPLELLFACGFMYIAIYRTKWIFGSEDTFNFLLFSLIPGYVDQIHGFIADYLTQRSLNGFEGILSAVLLACLGGILRITNPVKGVLGESDSSDEIYIKGWYIVRILVLICWITLNIYVVAFNNVAA